MILNLLACILLVRTCRHLRGCYDGLVRLERHKNCTRLYPVPSDTSSSGAVVTKGRIAMLAVSLFTPACMAFVWCYASSVLVAVQGKGTATGVFQPPMSEPLPERDCPSNCDLLFRRLENGTEGTGKVQHVEVQERGEPKSGTTFMYEWGSGALAHACAYLQRAYGRESCRIEWTIQDRKLVFEPRLAMEDDSAPCPCDKVEKGEWLAGRTRKRYSVYVVEACVHVLQYFLTKVLLIQ